MICDFLNGLARGSPFVLAQTNQYFLTAPSDISRFAAPSVMVPEGQRTNSESMTGATRRNSPEPYDEWGLPMNEETEAVDEPRSAPLAVV